MKKKLLILVIIVSLLFSSTVFAATEENFDAEFEFLGRVAKFIKANYLYDLTYEEIIHSLYNGVFNDLDPYSVYYTPDEYAEFTSEMSGEFSGVGIQIVKEGQNIVVVTPLYQSPAEKAGIMPKDIIRYVDGVDITGYSPEEAAKMIRGPVNTTVVLGVERNGMLIYYSIIRDTVVISSVYSEMMEENIGYLKITQFNENTAELLATHLSDLLVEDFDKLIIDLRNNPGGNLNEVMTILDLFIPAGPLAYLVRNDGAETEYVSTLSIQNFELAVLVNGGSASASEIFAGAVQDRKAGVVIGTKTYGKGVVQSMYPLLNGSAIKLTTAEYFTAGKNKVQGIGITPDIIVENRLRVEEIDTSAIPVFNKARKPSVGTVGLDVLAAEMILEILGYGVYDPDGVFDENLNVMVTDFQRDSGLFPYGVLDFTTQDALMKALEDYQHDDTVDLQLQKALELLR